MLVVYEVGYIPVYVDFKKIIKKRGCREPRLQTDFLYQFFPFFESETLGRLD
jgi:hypothetical protein